MWPTPSGAWAPWARCATAASPPWWWTTPRARARGPPPHPGGGSVGPPILEAAAATPQVQSDGGRIVWEVGGRSELIGRGQAPERGGGLQVVDFVPGAAMLVRRKVFYDIGLLPEEYFLYFEETEFCVRGAAAGGRG